VILGELIVEDIGLGVLFLLAFANGANDVGKSVASLMSTAGPGGPRLRSSRLALGRGLQRSRKYLGNSDFGKIVDSVHSPKHTAKFH